MKRQPAPNKYLIGRRFVVGSALVHLLVLLLLPAPRVADRAPPVLIAQLRPAPTATARLDADQSGRRPPAAPAMTRPEKSGAALHQAQQKPSPAETLAATASEPGGEISSPIAAAPAAPLATPDPAPAMAPLAAAPEARERRGKPSTLWLANYTQTISGKVSQLKQYPAIARLRGWQGTTVIVIQLAADGTVLSTRIAQSSGHDVLDLQALAMVRNAEPLPPFPQRHDGDPLTVQLPIVFALATPG